MDTKQEFAQKLFLKVFGPQTRREPRSDAYKHGVKQALLYRFAGEKIKSPYAIGTAESDAFYAGVDEGHLIFRKHEERDE